MENKKKSIISLDDLAAATEVQIKLRKLKRAFVAAAVIAAAILVAIGIIWSKGHKNGLAKAEVEIEELKKIVAEKDATIKEMEENPIVVTPVAPTITLDVINKEIKEIGELATMEYLYTDAGVYTNSRKAFKKFDIPLTQKTFTMKWDGSIKAGIDINQVTTTLDEESKTLTVYLPKAKILSHDPDKNSVEVFNEHDGIFNKVTVEDQVAFDAANETAMEERAIENGLLEKAEKNAEQVISRLLNANPIIKENYTIKFEHAQK